MYSQTISITTEKQIELSTDRDLELHGWDKPEVAITVSREGDLQTRTEGDYLIIESRSDLDVWIPGSIQVTVKKVEGDADIENLTGLLAVVGVGGDLDLNNIADTSVDGVGGDLDAKKVSSMDVKSIGGDCSLQRIDGAVRIASVGGDLDADSLGSLELINIGGDCNARNVSGEFSVANIGGDLNGADLNAKIAALTVGGDLNLRVKQGGVKAMTGGDLRLRFEDLTGEAVTLSAGGDVNLRLPPHASAKMHISSGGSDILMRVGGWNERVEMFNFDFSLGDGRVPIQITAGGDVVVSDGDLENHQGAGHFEFGGVKVDVDAISQTVQDAVQKATDRAEEASRRIEDRIQAEMHRMDDRKWSRGFRMHMKDRFQDWPGTSPTAPAQPAPASEPGNRQGKVSDEERKLILQMLQDHKISAEEAINLLDTLEGKTL
ncbi:MAG TPA: DUF4097 family beta strand repeat-containing protein [Longilinea sp.]|nr:DUF4097 family beta strand repeat-containing protein [Longilinea sp.]